MDVCIIPAYRVSKYTRPELRFFSQYSGKLEIAIKKNGVCKKRQEFKIDVKEEYQKIELEPFEEAGLFDIYLNFTNEQGSVEEKRMEYQVIDSGVTSTTVIDGLWISIYHWSEFEGQLFNAELRNLSDEDWKKQIYDMNEVGIKGVLIQNVFICNEYVNQHSMTIESYKGKSFYPSKLYQERMNIKAQNPISAILEAASECNMHVFLGVGHYAWFDFSRDSLEWHKNVTKELFDLYGKYDSFYGWYVSEEIMGDLYYSYPLVPDEDYAQVVTFFKEYKEFVRNLTPTKPIAFAPNNIKFEVYEKEWKQVLPNIDILLPFAFARDPEHTNILEIKRICNECDTHLWVDMEVFKFPFEHGLMPKNGKELIKEIRSYDEVEQIFGYQYTGLMNHPENDICIGRNDTKELYIDYRKYYHSVIKKECFE